MFAFVLGLATVMGAGDQAVERISVPQQVLVQGEPDVVIKGRLKKERRQEAAAFVRRVAPMPRNGQLGRWQQPICPFVLGVEEEFAVHVAARVRAAARQAGAPVGEPGCRGNALIAFVPDAQALIRIVNLRHQRLLAGVPFADRQALRASRSPILWWASSRIEGSDGDQIQQDGLGSLPQLRQYRSSLISTLTRIAYTGATVLVGLERSNGQRLDALADYAAFVLLSDARPTGPTPPVPTILNLYTAPAGDRPMGLTDHDRAYLMGLYRTPTDRTAMVQRQAITNRIVREGIGQDVTSGTD